MGDRARASHGGDRGSGRGQGERNWTPNENPHHNADPNGYNHAQLIRGSSTDFSHPQYGAHHNADPNGYNHAQLIRGSSTNPAHYQYGAHPNFIQQHYSGAPQNVPPPAYRYHNDDLHQSQFGERGPFQYESLQFSRRQDSLLQQMRRDERHNPTFTYHPWNAPSSSASFGVPAQQRAPIVAMEALNATAFSFHPNIAPAPEPMPHFNMSEMVFDRDALNVTAPAAMTSRTIPPIAYTLSSESSGSSRGTEASAYRSSNSSDARRRQSSVQDDLPGAQPRSGQQQQYRRRVADAYASEMRETWRAPPTRDDGNWNRADSRRGRFAPNDRFDQSRNAPSRRYDGNLSMIETGRRGAARPQVAVDAFGRILMPNEQMATSGRPQRNPERAARRLEALEHRRALQRQQAAIRERRMAREMEEQMRAPGFYEQPAFAAHLDSEYRDVHVQHVEAVRIARQEEDRREQERATSLFRSGLDDHQQMRRHD